MPLDKTPQTPLTYQEALDIIGGLSATSKMPWFSWSISALHCHTGSKLRKIAGSTCSKCYACKGRYMFPNVKDAHERRKAGLDHPDFVKAFVTVLETAYLKSRKTYERDGVTIKENRFRWHDSGDIQSLDHLMKINKIAEQTPYIDHWLPTREYGIVKRFLDCGMTFSPNLTVRMSAVMVGQVFPDRPMDLPFSTVGVDDEKVSPCSAYAQEGKCLNCRMCWDKDKDVNYPLH